MDDEIGTLGRCPGILEYRAHGGDGRPGERFGGRTERRQPARAALCLGGPVGLWVVPQPGEAVVQGSETYTVDGGERPGRFGAGHDRIVAGLPHRAGQRYTRLDI